MFIFQLPDATEMEVAARRWDKSDELGVDFPSAVVYEIHCETTPYPRECIDEV